MSVENFNRKPGIQNIPFDAKPLFARVAGELIGYNREVMEYGDGQEDEGIIKKIELRQLEGDRAYTILINSIVVEHFSLKGLTLQDCLEGVEDQFGPFGFDYDSESMKYGELVGEFNLEPITKRQEIFTTQNDEESHS